MTTLTTEQFTPDFRIKTAAGFFDKLLGFMGKRNSDHALLLLKCSSIHTFFMRFPIHVLFLDADFNIVKVVTGLKPWAIAYSYPKAVHILEIPSYLVHNPGILIGKQLPAGKSF